MILGAERTDMWSTAGLNLLLRGKLMKALKYKPSALEERGRVNVARV